MLTFREVPRYKESVVKAVKARLEKTSKLFHSHGPFSSMLAYKKQHILCRESFDTIKRVFWYNNNRHVPYFTRNHSLYLIKEKFSLLVGWFLHIIDRTYFYNSLVNALMTSVLVEFSLISEKKNVFATLYLYYSTINLLAILFSNT